MSRASELIQFTESKSKSIPKPIVKAIKNWAKDEAESVIDGISDNDRLSELDVDQAVWDSIENGEEVYELVISSMIQELVTELKKQNK